LSCTEQGDGGHLHDINVETRTAQIFPLGLDMTTLMDSARASDPNDQARVEAILLPIAHIEEEKPLQNLSGPLPIMRNEVVPETTPEITMLSITVLKITQKHEALAPSDPSARVLLFVSSTLGALKADFLMTTKMST
jgi:hypothetical protein